MWHSKLGQVPTVARFKQCLNNKFYFVTGGLIFTKGESTVDGFDVLESYKTIKIMLIVPKPLPNKANAAWISLFLHFSPEIMQRDSKTVVTRCQFHTVLSSFNRYKITVQDELCFRFRSECVSTKSFKPTVIYTHTLIKHVMVYCMWEKRIKMLLLTTAVLRGFMALWSEPDLVALFLLKSRSPPKQNIIYSLFIYFTHLIFKKAGINSVGRLNSANWTVGCWVFRCRWLLLVEPALKDISSLRVPHLALISFLCQVHPNRSHFYVWLLFPCCLEPRQHSCSRDWLTETLCSWKVWLGLMKSGQSVVAK